MDHRLQPLLFLELDQIPEKEHAQKELFVLRMTGCIMTFPVQIRPHFSLRMPEYTAWGTDSKKGSIYLVFMVTFTGMQ